MPISPVSSFKSAIAGLKPDSTPMWAKALADAVDGLVTNKAGLGGTVTGSFTFTFNKALFMSGIMAASATPVTPIAAQAIGAAWGNAMLASTMVTASAFVGSPALPTLFSVIISTAIDPPSVAAAQSALIATLSAMQSVKIAQDSPIAPALHTAFMSCTATITGLNSVPAPAGPLPLVAAMTPFL